MHTEREAIHTQKHRETHTQRQTETHTVSVSRQSIKIVNVNPNMAQDF